MSHLCHAYLQHCCSFATWSWCILYSVSKFQGQVVEDDNNKHNLKNFCDHKIKHFVSTVRISRNNRSLYLGCLYFKYLRYKVIRLQNFLYIIRTSPRPRHEPRHPTPYAYTQNAREEHFQLLTTYIFTLMYTKSVPIVLVKYIFMTHTKKNLVGGTFYLTNVILMV